MKKRILVTGASGFTGRYVCTALRNLNYEVYGLTTDSSINGRPVDLCDRGAVLSKICEINPTDVIHLAAISYVGHGQESDFFKVNVGGTINLLEAIDRNSRKIDRIVLASSANIYGSISSPIPISERTLPNPQNAYAQSKLQMEQEVARKFYGMPITIVRPFNYTGVGQDTKFLVPKIVKAFRERMPVLTLGNLDISRDFSDVRFVAGVYAELIQIETIYQPINLCSGVVFSINQICEMCKEITGYKPAIVSEKTLRRSSDIPILLGDPSLLLSVIKETTRIPFSQTLSWMLCS